MSTGDPVLWTQLRRGQRPLTRKVEFSHETAKMAAIRLRTGPTSYVIKYVPKERLRSLKCED